MQAFFLNKKKFFLGLIGIILALLTYHFLPDTCPEAARRMGAILILAAFFWAFEIFAPFITSLLIILLLIFALAKPGGVLGMGKNGYIDFLIPFSSPVIILFFGGFALASAMRKYKVDTFMIEKFLGRSSDNSYYLFLGIVLATAFLTMWISNTVTTILVLGILTPYLSSPHLDINFRKAAVLAIPFSANIGGIATPIASPPNAIAVGLLNTYGAYVSFLEWMMICVPLALILLMVEYLILVFLFPFDKKIEMLKFPKEKLSKNGYLTLGTFTLTVLLFVTTPFHEIPEALVALLSCGILTILGLLNRNDIKALDWDILILMWGGLALGIGVEKSGLANWVLSQPFFLEKIEYAIILFSFATLLLSLFMSNTATASLILPLGLGIEGIDKTLFAITITLICSLGMIFPISTPPNAVAFSSGFITSKEMIKAGTLIALISLAIILIGNQMVISYILN